MPWRLPSADPGLQALARDLIRKQNPEGVIGALKAMAEREDMTGFIKSFQMPLVLVHGDADALIPIDRAREVESGVLQARVFALKGVGHLPMMEAPQQTADALKHLA
jgi:pimeloyl-ACP methyl ester carboxylesterase